MYTVCSIVHLSNINQNSTKPRNVEYTTYYIPIGCATQRNTETFIMFINT